MSIDYQALAIVSVGLITLSGSILTVFFARGAKQAVQPNGTTLSDVLRGIIRQETYTHDRFHDTLNGQFKTNLILAMIAQELGVPIRPEMMTPPSPYIVPAPPIPLKETE